MILNEQYNTLKKFQFTEGKGSYLKKNKFFFLDLSCFNGVLFFGHNHEIFRTSLLDFVKKKNIL